MRFRVWERNSIKNHSLTLLDINFCIKSGLNSFSPPPRQVDLLKVTVYLYLGGGTKSRICQTTWTDSKWRPVPWNVMVFLIPNEIKTYLCGTKSGNEICCRILDWREMGVWVLKETITWTVRAWRPKHREYEVSLSLLQIGSNSYHEVTLRSLWFIYGYNVCDDHCRNPIYRSAKLLLYFV